MICHTMSAQVGAIEQVIQAVKTGELSQQAIQASVDRVRSLKARFLAPVTSANFDIKAHEDLASEIYAKSTTVVRSEPGVFPVSKDPAGNIVFVSPGKTPLGGGAVE